MQRSPLVEEPSGSVPKPPPAPTADSRLLQSSGIVSPKLRSLAAAAAFLISFVWFAATAENSGIASVFCDPVSRIASQDEAVYGREAIEMAAHENFLTPTYLGRYVLNKPPLMQILAAQSVRVFGASAWAVRFPSMVAAAMVTTLIFLLAWRMYSLTAAIGAALLLASSHLFYVFARFCMTDMLLTLWLTLALFVIALDPSLRRAHSLWMFSLACGAAILTKAAAGFMPILALFIHTALLPRDRRPGAARLVTAIAGAVAVALPWHIYQLAVHTRWFMTEYVWTAHFLVGVAAPPQYSAENHLVFYARRMFLMDPVLAVLAAAGLIPLARHWRHRGLLLAWTVTALLALFAFRYRSAYYLLPLLPAVALIASESLVLIERGRRWAAIALVLVCCSLKVASGSEVWGIPANLYSERPSASALERYCRLSRGNGLVLVDPDDEFYASILPIARVRYALMRAQPPSPPIDYAWLGIWMPADRFARFEQWAPLYRERLRSYGLNSDRPVGTVIWAQSAGEIESIIEAHPESDFSVPASMALRFWPASHSVVPGGPGRVFLLSKVAKSYSEARPCRL